MKYEKTKAQQQRKNDGYKKGAKRQAAKMSRRSGKQMLRELPIAHLSEAKRRDCLLELIDELREGWESGTANDMYNGVVSVMEKYDIDVQPLDERGGAI